MNRRLLLAIGASALIIAGSLPAITLAAGPHQAGGIDVTTLDPSLRPLARRRQADTAVTVILQLGSRPAVQPGLSRAAQVARARTLATAQAAVAAAAAKQGARVTGRYQYTYNGIRVRTTTSRLRELAAIPGVVAIHPVRVYKHANTTGVPLINTPATWTSGATGAGTIIAVIDSGIDYLHANFGGAGDPAAYATNNRAIVEPGSFPTTKVIGGYDFAGDGYDATGELGSTTPTPDGDPMDCGGHGSHVAGTAAGFGVLANHSPYRGLYTAQTIAGNTWTIGPGVAPEARLMALKVFGCEGSTDLVVDALEWVGTYNASHVVGIDVVNLSLGSPFGSNADPDAVQTNVLVASGVTVVAAAGNEAAVDYIGGAPAAATRAISVAALDGVPALPMAVIDTAGVDLPALNQNASTGLPVSGTLNVLGIGPSELTLGCDAADYADVSPGQIVAVKRGDCEFVRKAALAADAGAAAIIIVNRDDQPPAALPTFLGVDPTVAIPMLGTANSIPGGDPVGQPGQQMDATLIGLDNTAVTLKRAANAPRATYRQIAGFSSSGPRWGDSRLKPDLAAPGVSVTSTAVGTGYRGITFSGTSMAAPMTAGAAALVIQAHPGWSPLLIKAALSNTADNASVAGYSVLRSGSGLIRVDRAAAADVVATTSDGTASLSYGYAAPLGAWSSAKTITFTNDSRYRAVYSLASSSSTVKLSATSIAIGAYSSATVTARASLSATAVNGLCSPDRWDPLKPCPAPLYTRTGAVTATPVSARPGQYALRVPFLVVPRGASRVAATRSTTWTKSSGRIAGRINLSNTGGHAGTADVYALGVTDPIGDAKNASGVITKVHGTDIRATGVQVRAASTLGDGLPASDRAIYFAVNMHDRYSTAAAHEVDVYVDTTGDGVPDYLVFGYDYGVMATGEFSGEWQSFVVDLGLGPDGTIIAVRKADAPRNGSTVILSAAASDLGLAPGSPSFRYRVYSWDGFTGAVDGTGLSRAFDVYAPKQSNGQRKSVAKGLSTYVGAWFYRVTSVRGWLVVTMDDRNGLAQADIVGLPSKP